MSRAYTPRDEFEKTVKAGEAPAENVVLRKQYTCESIEKSAEADAPRTRQFIVSTASVDRDNDVIASDGWELGNYRKNPVVLFAHDYSSLPIAKCTDIKMLGGQLIATAEFADHEMANTVLRLIDGKFLNATSVGFRPIDFKVNEKRHGIDFSKQELLEFSVVPVPANPDALIVARELIGDMKTLSDWATKTLEILKADAPADGKKPAGGVRPNIPPPDRDQNLPDNEGEGDENTGAANGDDGSEPADDPDEADQPKPKPGEKPVPPKKKPVPPKMADEDIVAVAKSVVDILKAGCACATQKGHDPAACECCKGVGCACNACEKAFAMAEMKAGRVLSKKNETKVRAAHQHLDEVLACLQKDDGEGDTVEASFLDLEEKAADDVLVALDDAADSIGDVDIDMLREALSETLSTTMRAGIQEIVQTETSSIVSRMRGRLD